MSFRSVFRHKPFAVMWVGRLVEQIASQAQSVAIGWSVYTIARQTYDERESMFLVGMVGLAQFVPMFALTPLAGETADRYDRRMIRFFSILWQALCAAAFTAVSLSDHPSLTMIFIISGFFGVARTFGMPASTSLVPALVPADVLPKAVAWNTLGGQTGRILGPWVGGVLCAIAPTLANATACALFGLGSITCALPTLTPNFQKTGIDESFQGVAGGFF